MESGKLKKLRGLSRDFYLSFLSAIFRHIRVRKLDVSHPIGRSVERLTAHVAC